MNPSIDEAETRTFETLKSLGCKSLKNILNIEPDTKLKSILLDPSYCEQKLDILAWTICKFEPRLADEFPDYDFLQSDVKTKTKKVIESLNTLGLIDLGEFTSDHLLKTTERVYTHDLLPILDDLVRMINTRTKDESSTAVVDLDDLLPFHLNLSTSTIAAASYPMSTPITTTVKSSSHHRVSKTSSSSYQEKLNKRLQLTQDDDYWREFQVLAKPNLVSCIPPDMQRIIRSINERTNNTLYYQGNQGKTSIKKEELLSSLKARLEDLKKSVEINKNILRLKENNRQDAKLIELEQDSSSGHEKMSMGEQLEAGVNEMRLCIYEFNRFFELNMMRKSKQLASFMNDKTPLVDIDDGGSSAVSGGDDNDDVHEKERPKTDLECALDEFTQTYSKFKKICDNMMDWSKFLQAHQQDQTEYEQNCVLIKKNKIDRILHSIELYHNEIQEFMNMMGYNMIILNDKM